MIVRVLEIPKELPAPVKSDKGRLTIKILLRPLATISLPDRPMIDDYLRLDESTYIVKRVVWETKLGVGECVIHVRSTDVRAVLDPSWTLTSIQEHS